MPDPQQPAVARSAEVDAYLAAVPEPQRAALQALREALHALQPEATEVMSAGIPTLIHYGPLVGFGTNGTRCSLFVMQAKLLASMRSAITPPHAVSGATIHFPPESPLPPALLERVVRDRSRENQAAHIRAAQRNMPKRK